MPAIISRWLLHWMTLNRSCPHRLVCIHVRECEHSCSGKLFLRFAWALDAGCRTHQDGGTDSWLNSSTEDETEQKCLGFHRCFHSKLCFLFNLSMNAACLGEHLSGTKSGMLCTPNMVCDGVWSVRLNVSGSVQVSLRFSDFLPDLPIKFVRSSELVQLFWAFSVLQLDVVYYEHLPAKGLQNNWTETCLQEGPGCPAFEFTWRIVWVLV